MTAVCSRGKSIIVQSISLNMRVAFLFTCFQTITITLSISIEENGKDLPNNFQNNDDFLRRRKRPFYQSNSVPSGCHGSGRTFFNIDFNYQVNINCDVAGSQGGSYQPNDHNPLFNRPSISSHKPHFGGHHNKPGFGGHKPGIGSHKPVFGVGSEESTGGNKPFGGNRPIINGFLSSNAVSSFTSLFPTPEDIGNGFGNGLSSFLQTVPQIGQSFQSLLPNFGSLASSFAPPPGNQGGVSSGSTSSGPISGGSAVSPTDPLDPIDPDEMIYSDEIRPVNEKLHRVSDPYRRKYQSAYRRPSRFLSALFDW